MKQSFIPDGYTIDRERIASMINTELQEVHQLDIPYIEPNDPRLTDELCQEIADAWYEEPNPEPAIGALWDSEDDISEEWSNKLLTIFNTPLPPKQTDICLVLEDIVTAYEQGDIKHPMVLIHLLKANPYQPETPDSKRYIKWVQLTAAIIKDPIEVHPNSQASKNKDNA